MRWIVEISAADTVPTVEDILAELAKPGRDPRAEFQAVQFSEGVNELEDLREGMILQGVVTKVTRFGAFVDEGVHQDGLVHISQISEERVEKVRTSSRSTMRSRPA